jgi:tRNA (guanosine-2'-O-)-methyltransferase
MPLRFALTLDQKEALVTHLLGFVTPEKAARIQQVVAHRTRAVVVVIENLYQPHNISAVLRSCDCFGVQEVHVIEGRNPYRVNPDIALGATQWLTLHRHGRALTPSPTHVCLESLRQQGYRIAATTLRPNSISLQELDITQKTVLCYGNEEQGLSEEAHELADVFVQIPMVGFTQSLNISVSAALTLYDMTNKLHAQPAPLWQLPREEQLDLATHWLMQTTTHGRALIRHFFRQHQLPIPPELQEIR